MKVSKKSWHYRFLAWAMGYPPERNIMKNMFGGDILSDEPRGVASYYYNLVAHLICLPLILLKRGFFGMVDELDNWASRHKIELEKEKQDP